MNRNLQNNKQQNVRKKHMLQPYIRIYIYTNKTGDCLFIYLSVCLFVYGRPNRKAKWAEICSLIATSTWNAWME